MAEARATDLRAHVETAVCPSRSMQRVYALVERVAVTDLDVLICGEPGVGKEVVARQIHQMSRHSDKPFISVDAERLESSLMTGGLLGLRPFISWSAWATRSGISLYFDEIAQLEGAAQGALLQMILDRDSRRTDTPSGIRAEVRVLASTAQDLWKNVTTGRFREDLFLRLHAVEIAIPPLRERPEDIPVLVETFLRELEQESPSIRPVRFRAEQIEALAACRWPGNVRELHDFVGRLVREGTDLVAAVEERCRNDEGKDDMSESVTLSLGEAARLTSEAVERRLIIKALSESEGDPKRAAQKLHITEKALLSKIRNLQIAY